MLRQINSRAIAWSAMLRPRFYALAYPDFKPEAGVMLRSGCRVRATDTGEVVIGARTVFDQNCLIVARSGSISIGPDSYLAQGCIVSAIERVTIGRDALIGEYVSIRDQDHDFTRGHPYRSAGMLTSPIVIGDNVWIGAKSTITRGVSIGDNAVIGANSVVTKDIPANAIAAGAPARVVRMIEAVPERMSA